MIAVPLVFELVLLSAITCLLRQSEYEAWKANQTKLIIGKANRLTNQYFEIGTCVFAFNLTHSALIGARYDKISSEIPKEFAELKGLVSNDKADLLSLQQAEPLMTQSLVKLNTLKGAMTKYLSMNSFTNARKLRAELEPLMDRYLEILREFILRQQQKADVSPDAEKHSRVLLKWMILFGVVINVAVACFLAYLFGRGITSRLQILTQNTVSLGKGDQLRPYIGGTDELGQLDVAFHQTAFALSEASTKQKASEARLLSVIDNMPVGLILVNLEGTIQSSNPQARKMFNHVSEERFHQANLASLVPIVDQSFLQTLREKRKAVDVEGIREGGQRFSIEMAVNELQTDQGVQFLANLQDVTERHELERLKKEFAAMISHDLKTPLTAVQLTLAMMLNGAYGEVSDIGMTRLSSAKDSTERLIELIEQLLNLERMDAGMMDVSLGPEKLEEVIKASVESVRAYAERHQVTIDCRPTTLVASADKDRIIQVLINLISNAVKFSPPHETIIVSAHEIDNQIEVRVIDRGRGVPEHMRETIFDRFKQTEKADEFVKRGTGLGLAICKGIVLAHHGTIGVESELGKGSTFWFRLQLWQDDSQTPDDSA